MDRVFLWHLRHRPCSHDTLSCSIPSYLTASGKFTWCPPPTWRRSWQWEPFSTQSTICRQKLRWLLVEEETALYRRQAATTDIFRAFRKSGHHHFLPRIIGLYDDSSLSSKSTPPIDSLYLRTMFGCGTFTFEFPLTRRVVWCTGRSFRKLLARLTTALSVHFTHTVIATSTGCLHLLRWSKFIVGTCSSIFTNSSFLLSSDFEQPVNLAGHS